jgi:outer membrane protein W
MKKIAILLGAILVISAPCLAAGTLDFTARAGIYNAPGGVATSTIYGLSAAYSFTDNVSLRGMVETTSYTVSGQTVTYTPISLDLIYGQTLANYFRPYAGIGMNYSNTATDGSSVQNIGAQAEVGMRYDFAAFSAGLSFRYILPDLGDASRNSTSFDAYASGSMAQSINL